MACEPSILIIPELKIAFVNCELSAALCVILTYCEEQISTSPCPLRATLALGFLRQLFAERTQLWVLFDSIKVADDKRSLLAALARPRLPLCADPLLRVVPLLV